METEAEINKLREQWPCYGIHWDPKVPVCAGGINHAKPGDHYHERCQLFARCGALVTAGRYGNNAMNHMLIPPSSLTRPPTPIGVTSRPTTVAPAPAPLAVAPTSQQPTGLAALAQRLAPPPAQQPSLYQQQYPQHYQHPQSNPPAQPVQQMPPVYQMPGFLGAPEPIDANEPWYMPFGRELLRGGMKGLFHTAASFVDRIPLGRKKG